MFQGTASGKQRGVKRPGLDSREREYSEFFIPDYQGRRDQLFAFSTNKTGVDSDNIQNENAVKLITGLLSEDPSLLELLA